MSPIEISLMLGIVALLLFVVWYEQI